MLQALTIFLDRGGLAALMRLICLPAPAGAEAGKTANASLAGLAAQVSRPFGRFRWRLQR